LLSCNVENWDS